MNTYPHFGPPPCWANNHALCYGTMMCASGTNSIKSRYILRLLHFQFNYLQHANTDVTNAREQGCSETTVVSQTTPICISIIIHPLNN